MKARVIFYGGFHDSPEIRLYINFKKENINEFMAGKIGKKDLIDMSITPYQRRRLERHFCGNKECTCGSWLRATTIIL